MDNFTEADRYENILTFNPFALLGIIIMSALLIQSFIVAVNVNDWMKGRAITGADKIITSIGISRIFYHTAYLLIYVSWFYIQELCYRFATYIIFTSSYFSNICLSTLFSIFFYFKISTFHNIFFLRLKVMISRRIICLIIVSVLWSMVYSPVDTWINFSSFFTNSTEDLYSDSQQQMNLGWKLVWSIFPIFMFSTVSILLFILLGFHVYKMNNHGNAMSSTDTYHRSMKFTLFSFLIGVSHVLIPFIYRTMKIEAILWFDLIMNMFPALHSVLLIYVSTKLRKQFFRIVHCGTNALCNRNFPGPLSREPVEVTPL